MNNIKMIFQSKMLKNGMWLFVLQIFNTIVPMISLPYITRILGSEGYGEFSLALNWITYFQVLVEYGFGFWGARIVATSGKEKLQETFSAIITTRVLLMVLSFILMCVVYIFTGKPISYFICLCILFSMVFGVSFQLTWLFQGMQDMKYITIINAVSRTISLVLVFTLVKSANDIYLYCFLYSCTYLLSAGIGILLARKKYGLKFQLCRIGNVIFSLKDAWPLFISQAMSKVISGFGITVLGEVSTSSLVGIYSAIYKIPYILTLFFSPVSQAIYPDINIAFSKSRDIGINRVKKIAKIVLPIFFIPVVILIIFNKWIVFILFGIEYTSYSNLIVPLSLWFVFGMINNFLGIQTLIGSGHQKEYSKAFLQSTFLSILLYIILGKTYNIYGISFATLLSELFLTLILLINVKKILKK